LFIPFSREAAQRISRCFCCRPRRTQRVGGCCLKITDCVKHILTHGACLDPKPPISRTPWSRLRGRPHSNACRNIGQRCCCRSGVADRGIRRGYRLIDCRRLCESGMRKGRQSHNEQNRFETVNFHRSSEAQLLNELSSAPVVNPVTPGLKEGKKPPGRASSCRVQIYAMAASFEQSSAIRQSNNDRSIDASECLRCAAHRYASISSRVPLKIRTSVSCAICCKTSCN
jgi:hypothetical protein